MTEGLSEKDIEVLKQTPMFSALDEAQLEGLVRDCRILSRSAGDRIFGPSESADRFFVVLAGEIKIYKLSARGDEQILHLYGEGQTFGEAAMWALVNYPAFAVTLTEARLLVVSRGVLRKLITEHVDLAMGMMAGLSAKLYEFSRLIEQLSLKEVPARLAGVLLDEAGKAKSLRFGLPHSKRQLAGRIGTVPETLSRALSKLRQSGLIEVSGSQITILDAHGLKDLAGVL